MKNRLIKRTLLLLAGMSLTFSFTSCSNAFFGDDSGNMIADVTTRYDDGSGNTYVTITFTDEEMAPLTFSIPRGVSGIDGVGIEDIKSEMNESKTAVILTISYNDKSTKDTVITVPVVKGDNGVGIKECTVGADENGNTTITFVYTDDTTSPVITIPKGVDGVGIASFEKTETDNGEVTIKVTLTDGQVTTFTVKNGAGISEVTYNEEASTETEYVLTVLYTDGFTQDISIPKPRSTKWFSGTENPNTATTGINGAMEGDFYLNQLNGYVYQYQADGTWKFLFGMKGDSTAVDPIQHKITFLAGEGRIPSGVEGVEGAAATVVHVEEGKTLSHNLFPENPILTGYTFGGWFVDPSDINCGQFTDMTVVTTDLILNAKYVLNS